MRRLVLLALALALAGCGDGGNARVTDAGPCLVVIERTVCVQAGEIPSCRPEVLMTVRRIPACMSVDRERGA